MSGRPKAYHPEHIQGLGGSIMRKRRSLLLGALAGLIGVVSCSRKSLAPPRLPAPGQATLSVLTYNVNYAAGFPRGV